MMEAIVGDYDRESFVKPDPKVVQGALTEVPDVRGRSQSAAEQRLREAGFRAYVVEEVPSQLPAGTVVDTRPGPYSQYPSGGSIGIVISNGSPPQQDPPGNGTGRPDDEPDDDNEEGDGNSGSGGGNDGGTPVPEPTSTAG
jgi:beta-lactam-binding protein with PASTA domain